MKAARTAIPARGWIDLQVNGYEGVNFSSPTLTLADVRRVVTALARRGTAAFCPTVISSPPATYEAVLPVLAAAHADPDLRPHLLGIHIEGPFIAPPAHGAHVLETLRLPDTVLFDRWQKWAAGRIRLLTLAPELAGAARLIRHAAARGVIVSLGHHVAGAAAIAAAVRAGARCCTHLGNGIPNTLPRHPNPIWSQLAEDGLTALLITDGHHLPAEFVRVALRAKGVGHIIVTSDSAAIAGLPPGEYRCGDIDVVSEPSGRLRVRDGDSLAGSSATMADCMRWLASVTPLSAATLRRLGRLNALRLLGLPPR